MTLFRNCAREVVRKQFRYRRGAVPAAHRTRLRSLLAVFAGGADKWSRLVRVVLEALCTGDVTGWVVEHICVGPQCCLGEEECLDKFPTYFLAVLLGFMCPIFQRRRWEGRKSYRTIGSMG